MLSGTHRNSLQEQVIYGRPTLEALTDLGNAFGAHRLMITRFVPSNPGNRLPQQLVDEVTRRNPCEDADTGCSIVLGQTLSEAARSGEGGSAAIRAPITTRWPHPTEGRIRYNGIPSRWNGAALKITRHAPRLGEHSVAVLKEAGIAAEGIAALVRSGTTIDGAVTAEADASAPTPIAPNRPMS
jgi:hypothetical protein